MKKYIIVFVLLFVSRKIHSANSTVQQDNLVAVVTLFRHGDRSPTKSFPNDPYFNESFWPMGHGQLTSNGIMRMYELGKWYRNRYSSFLSEVYSPKDIFVRSTDVDRCLMSAYAVLAGLFQSKTYQKWHADLFFQPVPVHAVPSDQDNVLAMTKTCPKYVSLLQKTLSSKYVRKLTSKFSSFLNIISNSTGWNTTDVSKVAILQTTLDVYSNYNASFLPTWAKFLDQKILSYLAGVNHQRYTLTPELKRLLLGPFWSNFLRHFDNVINNTAGTPKFLMLSAHDTTIVSILNSMRMYDFSPPQFGAALIWELRKRSDGNYFVNLLYKRSSTKADWLIFKKFGVNCDYQDFKLMVESFAVDGEEWEEECEDSTPLNRTKSPKKPFYT